MTNESLRTAAAAYRNIYENQAPLVRFLHGLNIPIPQAFQAAGSFAASRKRSSATMPSAVIATRAPAIMSVR